jgi:flagellar protein FlaF
VLSFPDDCSFEGFKAGIFLYILMIRTKACKGSSAMAKSQIGAYEQVQKQNLSSREIEARAFTKAAVLLEDAKRDPSNFEGMREALHFNQMLWTIIQSDLGDPGNKLEAPIKANVMSLSIFVDKQTLQALSSENVQDLEPLININRNLAAGLREKPAAGASAAAAPSSQQPMPRGPIGGVDIEF